MYAHRQLLREQFIELDAAPRRVRAVLQRALRRGRRRMMQKADAFAESGQPQFFEQRRWQGVGKVTGGERVARQALQVGLAQARRGRIHRRQGLRDRRICVHHAILRVHHLCAEKSLANFPEQAHARAGCQLLHLAAVKIEKTHGQHARLVFDRTHQLALGPVLDRIVGDDSLDQCGRALGRCADAMKLRFIVVAHGQVQHEIELALYAQLGESGEDDFAILRERRVRDRRGIAALRFGLLHRLALHAAGLMPDSYGHRQIARPAYRVRPD